MHSSAWQRNGCAPGYDKRDPRKRDAGEETPSHCLEADDVPVEKSHAPIDRQSTCEVRDEHCAPRSAGYRRSCPIRVTPCVSKEPARRWPNVGDGPGRTGRSVGRLSARDRVVTSHYWELAVSRRCGKKRRESGGSPVWRRQAVTHAWRAFGPRGSSDNACRKC